MKSLQCLYQKIQEAFMGISSAQASELARALLDGGGVLWIWPKSRQVVELPINYSSCVAKLLTAT